MNKETTRWIEQ